LSYPDDYINEYTEILLGFPGYIISIINISKNIQFSEFNFNSSITFTIDLIIII